MSNYKIWCERCQDWTILDYDRKCTCCGTLNPESEDDEVDFYDADFMNDFGDN